MLLVSYCEIFVIVFRLGRLSVKCLLEQTNHYMVCLLGGGYSLVTVLPLTLSSHIL